MYALVMYFNVDHLFFFYYLFIPLIRILLYIYFFYPYVPLSEKKIIIIIINYLSSLSQTNLRIQWKFLDMLIFNVFMYTEELY